MKYSVVAVLLTVMSKAVLADGSASASDETRTKVTDTPVVQTQKETTRAGLWSLDIKEYQRYQVLMEGPLGHWNPTIDPLLALGMFAETPIQQRRYAELYARQEFELTERTLRFQQAYRVAFQRLYPNIETVDRQLLAPYQLHQQQKVVARDARRLAKQQFKEGDRVMVFVPPRCDRCSPVISRLMGLVSGTLNVAIDLYVRNASDDAAVRAWAQAHQFDLSVLDENSVTLNRDEGLFQRLQSRSSAASVADIVIYLKRNGQFYQLRVEELGL